MFDTASPPGSGPPHKDTFATTPWLNQTDPVPLSNLGSNRGRRLLLLPSIPASGKRIEKWDLDSVHTEPEKPPFAPAPPLEAAFRLFPGLPIKALDPAGTGFLLFITTNGQKVAEKIARSWQFISASQLYYRFAPVEHPHNLAGDRALMP